LSQAAIPGASGASTGNTLSDAIVDATRQLAQPREAPGSSQRDNHVGATTDASRPTKNTANVSQPSEDTGKELMEGLQVENDEIVQMINENEGATDNNLCRLVARVLLKQDAICRTLQGMKHTRRTVGSGSALPGDGSGSAPSPGDGPGSSPPRGDGPTPTSNGQRPPRTSPPQASEPNTIRREMNKLLKRKNNKQPLPPPPPPEIRYPTEENFGIRWEEMEKCLFNRMAADVVTEYLRRHWEAEALTKSELGELPRMVSDHIRYLCRTWKNVHREDAEDYKKAQLLSAAAASRRATLYESRLKIIDRFPSALNMHRNLIVRLGLAGTSSDEEDPSESRVFYIKRRPELSSRVNILKSQLDLAYNLYCKGPGSKGSQMHTRVPSDKVSTRPLWVQGLPVTCLSRAWFNTLSEPEKEFYQFVGHRYDYTFPAALLKRSKIGREPHMMTPSDDEPEDNDGDEDM
ncbi:hypothetical protein FRC07_007608, partial [Ceratobasidium sp. 392]